MRQSTGERPRQKYNIMAKRKVWARERERKWKSEGVWERARGKKKRSRVWVWGFSNTLNIDQQLHWRTLPYKDVYTPFIWQTYRHIHMHVDTYIERVLLQITICIHKHTCIDNTSKRPLVRIHSWTLVHMANIPTHIKAWCIQSVYFHWEGNRVEG